VSKLGMRGRVLKKPKTENPITLNYQSSKCICVHTSYINVDVKLQGRLLRLRLLKDLATGLPMTD